MNTEKNIKTLIIKKPLRLDCGKTINNFPIAFETYGSLNENKDNAILVFHALTGDQFVTGLNPVTKKEILELRRKLNKNILLVIDDAYSEYMKNNDYSSGLELFKNKDNVFILRTFSKMFGLASLRIGWGYGSKQIIRALNIIKPPFNVNGLAQVAAAESLKDKQFIQMSIKHNLNYANRLKKFLEKYNIFSNAVSANFLLLNFDECKYSANFLYQKLKNKGIILRSTEDGYHIKNKLRLTIGSSRENLIFMNAVRKIFN